MSYAQPNQLPRRLTLIWMALVFAFLFLPIAVVILYSFNGGRNLFIWTEFSTRWYWLATHNPRVVSALMVSLQVAALNAAIAVIIGTPAGVALAKFKGHWVGPFTVLIFIVIGTPELVSAIGQLIWLDRIGIYPGLPRLAIGHSSFSIAVVILIVRARAEGLNHALDEAAADLGAPPLRRFLEITLPLMLPAVLAGGLLAFVLSFDDVIISLFLQRPGSSTLPIHILSSFKPGLKGDVAAIVVLTLGITLAVIIAAVLILRRGGRRGAVLEGLAG